MLDSITSNINSFGDFIDAVTNVVPKIISTCAIAATLIPKPVEDGALSFFHKAINMLGFNFGEAANK